MKTNQSECKNAKRIHECKNSAAIHKIYRVINQSNTNTNTNTI